MDLANAVPISKIYKNILESKISHEIYDVIDLNQKILSKGKPYLQVKYKKKIYAFKNLVNMHRFMATPHLFYKKKLPVKLPLEAGSTQFGNLRFDDGSFKENKTEKADCTEYLDTQLGNVVMRVMAQLGNLYFNI